MSDNKEITVDGHRLNQVTIGAESVYAGLTFYTKEALTLQDAAKQAGSHSVLAGFNSSLNSALSAKARSVVFEGQTKAEGESPAAFTKRCVDAFKASGRKELLSQAEAEAFVYGSRTLTITGVSTKLSQAQKALKAEKAKGKDASPVEIAAQEAQIARFAGMLTTMAKEAAGMADLE